ncbi:MAG: HD family phosphohydrolase [Nitrospirales bacterium]|nr:MAG: HD family phosphohydrolase [Nitrospirales bacterium]
MTKASSSPVRPPTASTTKRIATSQLKSGMFLVGVYQSWWKSPFFRHNRLLKSQKEVDLLLKSDVKEVMIDPSRGLDVSEELEGQSDESRAEAQQPEIDVVLGEDTPLREEDGPASSPLSPQVVSLKVKHDALVSMERVFEGVKTGASIDHPKLQQTMQALLEQVFAQEQAMAEVYLIQNLQQFDKTLYEHVVDVAILSVMVGIQLGLHEKALEVLALGGLLHDVGHVRIPRNLLRRKYELAEHEQVIFERHVDRGLAILEQCPAISSDVHRVVAEHHERQDGSGYPSHRTADELLVLSDIIGFVDQLDALVSHWGPPPGLPTALAIRKLYLAAQNGKLRTESVEALIRCLGVYPLGSLVSLSTGEWAVVIKINPFERLKPLVNIITDHEGNFNVLPFIEDLAVSHPSGQERVILDILNPISEKVDVAKYFPRLHESPRR